MCNLSEGVLEEGREQERQKFAEERKRFFETAVSLVRDGLLGPHEAAERFGLPEEDLLRAVTA